MSPRITWYKEDLDSLQRQRIELKAVIAGSAKPSNVFATRAEKARLAMRREDWAAELVAIERRMGSYGDAGRKALKDPLTIGQVMAIIFGTWLVLGSLVLVVQGLGSLLGIG